MPRAISSLLAAALVVGSCAGSESGTAEPPADAAWRTTLLRDVRSGATFTIADLVGRVVVIEPMAIWCVTCRAQQLEVATALDALAAEGDVADPRIRYVSLDIEPTERPDDLAAYATGAGFGWTFAVAPIDVSRSLADEFGSQVLSPPATPSIVIAPDGSVAGLTFGIRSAEQLGNELRALLPRPAGRVGQAGA